MFSMIYCTPRPSSRIQIHTDNTYTKGHNSERAFLKKSNLPLHWFQIFWVFYQLNLYVTVLDYTTGKILQVSYSYLYFSLWNPWDPTNFITDTPTVTSCNTKSRTYSHPQETVSIRKDTYKFNPLLPICLAPDGMLKNPNKEILLISLSLQNFGYIWYSLGCCSFAWIRRESTKA